MAIFTLRIYRRRRPNEAVGQLTDMIDLEAREPEAAEQEARAHLQGLNWETHFAGVMGEASLLKLWANEHA